MYLRNEIKAYSLWVCCMIFLGCENTSDTGKNVNTKLFDENIGAIQKGT